LSKKYPPVFSCKSPETAQAILAFIIHEPGRRTQQSGKTPPQRKTLRGIPKRFSVPKSNVQPAEQVFDPAALFLRRRDEGEAHGRIAQSLLMPGVFDGNRIGSDEQALTQRMVLLVDPGRPPHVAGRKGVHHLPQLGTE